MKKIADGLMSKIGIIGAMEVEVAQLKEKMENVQVKTKANMVFCEGTLNGKPVVVVRSGIGKVNAAVCTQILIDDYKADAIINTGIAGSLKNEINIGDVVVSKEAMYHDMDATGFGYPKGCIPQMETSCFPAHEGLVLLAVQTCRAVNPEIGVSTGTIVSGDQFISSGEKKDEIKKEFDASCTEMEGAAIAHAAWLNEVPFVIIRAISDKADNSASMDYDEFEKQAVEHSVRLVEHMVKAL